jgi:ElaB/YqjD/DUF883 family membrane-anchored ribosome-binding protein
MDTSRTDAAIAEAASHAHSTAERLTSRAHSVTDRVSSRAHETVDQVATAAHRTADRLATNSEQWVAAKDELAESVRRYVREHPFAALGTAVAVGFVLSRLTR